MATPGHHPGNSMGPDTPITIKIGVNESLKKLKLPLKDLAANVLIDKLRHCLNIKPEQQAVFERFSDSAGCYITLEPSNAQVFKTLIRAAKAKSKLRLKATVTPDLDENKSETMPERVTPAMLAQEAAEPVIVRSPVNQTAPPRDSTALDGRSVGSGIFEFREARASQQTLVNDDASLPHAFTADRSEFFNGIARASNPAQRELAFRSREPAPTPVVPVQGQWSVYCNGCDAAMQDAHYHCSVCDGGDYDLCESCINSGTLCPGEGHWLIKRSIKDGKVVTSTTERIGRKFQKEIEKEIPGAYAEESKTLAEEPRLPTRTCNNCVYVLPEHEFVTCTTCEDFDLCIPCHDANKHGHHPAHGFKPATADTVLTMAAEAALAPGRHVRHSAICDGCDNTIYGIRHKCLNCPDWDYCNTCVQKASIKHPRHRFAAIYSPIPEPRVSVVRHTGIYCDGPLCKNKGDQSYITGVRYKCAVCHDTDFCASCEALPCNHHNRTHPIIKFKTPVRNVSVATMNEDVRGHVRNMGDNSAAPVASPAPTAHDLSDVETVAEIKPETKAEKTLPIPVFKPEIKVPVQPTQGFAGPASVLSAAFVKDSIQDGTVVSPGARFTQIWTLKNDGAFAWPAGCSVRYVGGDNMLNVDHSHPSSVSDITDATESNIVGREVHVGEEIAFKLVLRAPMREGKSISYWRVKAPDGTPFGHRLWCDIDVKDAAKEFQAQKATIMRDAREDVALEQSQKQQRLMMLDQQRRQAYMQHQLQQQMRQQSQPVALPKYLQNPQPVMRPADENRSQANVTQHDPTTTYEPGLESFDFEGFYNLGSRRDGAKLRTDMIRAKMLKARLEQHKHAAQAKATRATAEKKNTEESAKVKQIIDAVTKDQAEDVSTSQMVFPKLEKESPEASIIQPSSSSKGKAAYVEDEENEENSAPVPASVAPSVSSARTVADEDDLDAFTDLEVLSADDMDSEDDGFMTDEEYDILDASDQETVASK